MQRGDQDADAATGQVWAGRDRHRAAVQLAEIATVSVEHHGTALDGGRAAIALLARGELDRTARLTGASRRAK
jgi:hypothetical protein